MEEVQINWNAYVVGDEAEDNKYYPIINPVTKLVKPLIKFGSEKNPISSPELYIKDKELMVFPAEPIKTDEGLIKPLRESVPLNTFSQEEQADIIKAALIRHEAETEHFQKRCQQQYQQEPLCASGALNSYQTQNSIGVKVSLPMAQQYSFDNGKLILQVPENPEPEILANFDLEPVKEVTTLQGEKKIGGVVEAVIVFKDHRTKFSINSYDVKNVLSYARKADIQCIVEYDPSKVVEKITNHFLSKLENIPKEYVQTQAGWTLWNGKYIFAHDARRDRNNDVLKFQTGVSVLSKELSNTDIINIFRSILGIAPMRIMAPLIATALLGTLFQLFSSGSDEYRPSFVTFINGQSGSLKTAVAKMLFTLFNADNPRVPASFKDTATSMEIRLRESRSAVALIDDYYATNVSAVKNEMQKNLETVIRYVGDGISRNRSNANLEDVKGTRPECMVVITGEDTDGQLSTLLRCLVINVDKRTFDGKLLELFQQDKLLWSTFQARFIEYVEDNYHDIEAFIKSNFSTIRQMYRGHFNDLRPVDQMVQLHLVYKVLGEFLSMLGVERGSVERYCSDCIDGCYNAVKISAEYATENSAENQYPIAVCRLIGNGELNLAQSSEQYIAAIGVYDGYETNEYYILDSEKLYSKVVAYFRRLNRGFSLSPKACKAVLHKAGLIRVEYENRGKDNEKLLYELKVTLGGKKHRDRRLHIIKETLEAFMESKF